MITLVIHKNSCPTVSASFFQVKNLTLKIEQETQKRNLTQNDLKAQNQQLNSLRTSEKQLKQEMNHLLDIKRSLEKQNQELRKSVFNILYNCFLAFRLKASYFDTKRMMSNRMFLFSTAEKDRTQTGK